MPHPTPLQQFADIAAGLAPASVAPPVLDIFSSTDDLHVVAPSRISNESNALSASLSTSPDNVDADGALLSLRHLRRHTGNGNGVDNALHSFSRRSDDGDSASLPSLPRARGDVALIPAAPGARRRQGRRERRDPFVPSARRRRGRGGWRGPLLRRRESNGCGAADALPSLPPRGDDGDGRAFPSLPRQGSDRDGAANALPAAWRRGQRSQRVALAAAARWAQRRQERRGRHTPVALSAGHR